MNGDPRVAKIAGDLGLHHGRRISPSKSGYRSLFPGNFVIFNATIADDDGHRLWAGDLDLTRDEEKLVAFAQALGQRLYVLFEGDAWSDEGIGVDVAAIVIFEDGGVSLTYRYGIERNVEGRIVRPAPQTEPDAESSTDAQGH